MALLYHETLYQKIVTMGVCPGKQIWKKKRLQTFWYHYCISKIKAERERNIALIRTSPITKELENCQTRKTRTLTEKPGQKIDFRTSSSSHILILKETIRHKATLIILAIHQDGFQHAVKNTLCKLQHTTRKHSTYKKGHHILKHLLRLLYTLPSQKRTFHLFADRLSYDFLQYKSTRFKCCLMFLQRALLWGEHVRTFSLSAFKECRSVILGMLKVNCTWHGSYWLQVYHGGTAPLWMS